MLIVRITIIESFVDLVAVFSLLYSLVQALQPYATPILSCLAWFVLVLIGWSIITAVRDGITEVKHLHRIPCARCQYFTGDYHLKCTVHPTWALSEAAINCSDYRLQRDPFTPLTDAGDVQSQS